MIPPQILQYIQQLAASAGQTVQQWIASNPDKIQELLRHGAIHLGQHSEEYFAKIKKWWNNL